MPRSNPVCRARDGSAANRPLAECLRFRPCPDTVAAQSRRSCRAAAKALAAGAHSPASAPAGDPTDASDPGHRPLDRIAPLLPESGAPDVRNRSTPRRRPASSARNAFAGIAQRVSAERKGTSMNRRTTFVSLAMLALTAFPAGAQFYKQTNLVSDIAGMAQLQDSHLVNPWGVSH